MTSKRNWIVVILVSLLHLCCDLFCGYKVSGILYHQNQDLAAYLFFVYNGIAFVLQPLSGLFLDKYGHEKEGIVLSFLLLLLGVLVPLWWLSPILLGIGNNIFHVSGSKVCTNITTSKAKYLGLFVSLGAIGLAVGTNLYQYTSIVIVCFICYALFTGLLYLIPTTKEEELDIYPTHKNGMLYLVGLMVSISVFIRAYSGTIMHFEFTKTTWMLYAFPICAALGKMAGGFLLDRFGSLKTIVFWMVLGTIILIFDSSYPILMMCGTIAINIAMPVTLFELNRLLHHHEGLSFGILAAMLFPGTTLGLYYSYTKLTYILIIIFSSLFVIVSIYLAGRIKHE